MRCYRWIAPVLGVLLLGILLLFAPRAPLAAPVPGGGAGNLALLDSKGQVTGECPLKHTDVQADVSGFVARVTVKQEFRNPAQGPVEAVYTFPLPNDAAVDDMTMTIGPRVVKG